MSLNDAFVRQLILGFGELISDANDTSVRDDIFWGIHSRSMTDAFAMVLTLDAGVFVLNFSLSGDNVLFEREDIFLGVSESVSDEFVLELIWAAGEPISMFSLPN